MATLEEVYAKIVSDDGEKKALAEAFATEEGAAAFMERHGCEAKPAELVALLKEKACATGEVSDGELEGAAGGGWGDWLISIMLVGVGCAFGAVVSAIVNSDAVQQYENEYADKSANSEVISMC